MVDGKLLTASASPHVRAHDTTRGIMLDVVIALCPALIASVVLFGFRALAVTAVCVVCCVLFEFLSRKAMRRANTIGDLSAVVTGVSTPPSDWYGRRAAGSSFTGCARRCVPSRRSWMPSSSAKR